MSGISWICFSICVCLLLSLFRHGGDPLSPSRIFGFIWSLSIGLADLKFSAYQQTWSTTGWMLLLIAVFAFLVGTFAVYVLNLKRNLKPIPIMRELLGKEQVKENRLFWLTCVVFVVYVVSYVINYVVKGWLPIEASAKNLSRVDFNVTGLTFLIYLVPAIMFFITLYFIKVSGKKVKKIILVLLGTITLFSFLLFVSRFQIIFAFVLCGTLLYYGTHYIRPRTALMMATGVVAFFFWISSIRLSKFVALFLYYHSRMNFPKAYAFFTEPYMYFVMNLENFVRAANQLDYHTYGYYTFDFITAAAGLKYSLYEYFNLNRHPFLISGYNTYSAFWSFYCDFGVVGLALIPFLLGFGVGLLYYRMRSAPTIKNVTAYGIMIFVVAFTFFVFPLSFLWFEFDLLVIYVTLRWTIVRPAMVC